MLQVYLSVAQRAADQVRPVKRYSEEEVLDSLNEINMYTRLVAALGGDSTAYYSSGYSLQGWNEDFYKSGRLLHRGYYVDGKLITFKNFFENGQCERSVENSDPLHCTVDVFFESGRLSKKICYFNALPQKRYEYYETGLPKYTEENDREMKYLTLKKTWYRDGALESSLELHERKNKRYGQKKYYTNGQVKEEGIVILLSGTHEYVKDGTWYSYDNNGKNKLVEKFTNGIKLNSRQ